MCVHIVWEGKMIAVIRVIILAVKGSLGYCVFALLPFWGSGLHNPHPSTDLGSKIPFLSCEWSRCPKYPHKINVLFALVSPAVRFLSIMKFKVLKDASVHNPQNVPIWRIGNQWCALCFQSKQVFWGKGNRHRSRSKLFDSSGPVKPWATLTPVPLRLPVGVLFLCNYRAFKAQLQHQQRCVTRWLTG